MTAVAAARAAADPLALARTLAARGLTLEAIETLRQAAAGADPAALTEAARQLAAYAIASFNAHREAGELDMAERYAAALTRLLPGDPALLGAAFECNRALGRWEAAAAYARALAFATAEASASAPPPDPPAHPLLRLRDLHDASSALLCRPLTDGSVAEVRAMLAAAADLMVDVDAGSEWADWDQHYRLLLAGVDLDAVLAPTPDASVRDDLRLATAGGAPADWADLAAAAARLGAKVVFLAAADEAYFDLYARWYVRSILKFSDVPCLVVLHAIGGAARLEAIARNVGLDDARLFFAGDGFDAAAVTTACCDAPPKGRAAKPLAHLQSVRFQRLGALSRALDLPVFVSDIDLMLQRGVADLLDQFADADVVVNENGLNQQAGSRLTANLLLLNPTPDGRRFADFLAAYLDDKLARPAVSRWIDQLGLLMARHHLTRQAPVARIGSFDTDRDINNVMYPAYQPHPFRFLSLFHGFDMASLEGVLG